MNENDLAEKAFQNWKERNSEILISEAPATEGLNGAASNFSHWCRRVYTGRIELRPEVKAKIR